MGDENRNCYKQVKEGRKQGRKGGRKEGERDKKGREANFEYVLSTKKEKTIDKYYACDEIMDMSSLYTTFYRMLCTAWPGTQKAVTFARCINLY